MAISILRYRKTTFFPTLVLLSIALSFLNIFLGVTFFQEAEVLIFAILASVALLLVLGISPFLTYHSLDDSELRLRQGWYFKAIVPLTNIEQAQIVERGPMRTGVFFEVTGKSLYVTTQRSDLILLSLKQPQRFGFAWGKRAGRVYFDTIDKNVILRRMAEKFLTPSNQGRSS
jgi:membrane protein YdbS with pleckstrin-like domain